MVKYNIVAKLHLPVLNCGKLVIPSQVTPSRETWQKTRTELIDRESVYFMLCFKLVLLSFNQQ